MPPLLPSVVSVGEKAPDIAAPNIYLLNWKIRGRQRRAGKTLSKAVYHRSKSGFWPPSVPGEGMFVYQPFAEAPPDEIHWRDYRGLP